MTKWQTEVDVPDFGEARIIPGSDSDIPYDHIEVEDGGRALIYHVEQEGSGENGFFVHLRSWVSPLEGRLRREDAEKLRAAHTEFAQFAGRRVRITVEVIE